MTRKSLCLLIGASILALVIAACGTAATPEWAAAAQGTRVAIAATSDHETAIAPTNTPTDLPTSTPSPIPPTATSVPATATAVPPTATTAPTSEPIVEATAAATAEAGMGGMTMDDNGNAAAVAAALKAGDPANGKVIFNTVQAATGYACATCHSVTPDGARIIGPGLYNVSVHGAMHVPGENAVQYVRESILNPQAHIAVGDPPFPQNLMPQIFGQIFSEQQINDIIAYLMTLHS